MRTDGATHPFWKVKILIQNGCGFHRAGSHVTPAAGRPGQRGVSVVTDSEVASTASLMCTLPSLMPAFIAPNTLSG